MLLTIEQLQEMQVRAEMAAEVTLPGDHFRSLIETAMQVIAKGRPSWSEVVALDGQIMDYRRAFHHTHIGFGPSPNPNPDACRQCGLDLRDKIHTDSPLWKDA